MNPAHQSEQSRGAIDVECERLRTGRRPQDEEQRNFLLANDWMMTSGPTEQGWQPAPGAKTARLTRCWVFRRNAAARIPSVRRTADTYGGRPIRGRSSAERPSFKSVARYNTPIPPSPRSSSSL